MKKEFDQSEIDDQIEERLVKMMRENPARVMMYFVTIAGKESVLANAAHMTLSTEATIEGKRYKITTITKVKKIKNSLTHES